ncbi:MAG TPA: outer membrane protein assembly factor BamB [Burkholderiales bacterium]|nr:outer membrane protein assembly factor BamB [Burkholderiales bacterium]
MRRSGPGARAALAAALTAVVLLACASSGPKPAELVEFTPKARTKVVWRAAVGKAQRHLFRPAVLDGAVYAAGATGELARFEVETGRQVWRVNTGARLSGGVGLGAGQILVGSAKGVVLAYDPDGKLLWRSKVSSEVLSAPAGNSNVVIVRSGDSKVFGLNARDGARLWEYQAAAPPLTLRAAPGIVLVGENAVVAGFPGGKLLVLSAQTGAVLWETAVATPRGDNELERIADIAGAPLVESDRICAVTYQGRVGCYDTERGRQLWVRPASSAGTLGAAGTVLYYTEEDGAVVALDKTSGTSVWKQDKLHARKVSSPLPFDSYVVVGDYKGYVHFLSREDGSFAARIATDGTAIVAQPVAIEGKVLVQTAAGGLFAISVKSKDEGARRKDQR